MKAITLEEHAAFPSLGDNNDFYNGIWKVFPGYQQKAWDYGALRLADMDAGNVSLQVLSHLPGIGLRDPARCQAANNEMAKEIQANPNRFAGFAALPMAVPDEAARELHRAVTDLGFRGALVDNHLEDMTQYDDARFWPVFEVAEKLDVPIYLHPSPAPAAEVEQRFAGNYPWKVQMGLTTGAWGWHENVGLHILKLYAAGVFERFPQLKIIIGHMGELLPMMLHRVARLRFFQEMAAERKKSILDVWDENIWVTTSGMFSVSTFKMLQQVTRIDHILFSVDYPFESNTTGRAFLEELRSSETLTHEELEMVAWKNGHSLLKL
ncbi:hypothetical protein Plec18170_001548 [Paecilomyces lecythidis]